MSLKASLTALCPSKNIRSPSPNQPRGARGQGLNVFRGRGGVLRDRKQMLKQISSNEERLS